MPQAPSSLAAANPKPMAAEITPFRQITRRLGAPFDSARGETPAGVPREFMELHSLLCWLDSFAQRLTMPLAKGCSLFIQNRTWFRKNHVRLRDYAREKLGRSDQWLRGLACLHEQAKQHEPLRAELSGADAYQEGNSRNIRPFAKRLPRETLVLIARRSKDNDVAAMLRFARQHTRRQLLDAIRQKRFALTSTNGPASLDTPPEPTNFRLRLSVPAPMFGVLEETRDLVGALQGRNAGPRDFLESLKAEVASFGLLSDIDEMNPPVHQAPAPRAAKPAAILQQTLPTVACNTQLKRRAFKLCEELQQTFAVFENIDRIEGDKDWRLLVRCLRSLVDADEVIAQMSGDLLRALDDLRVWRHTGVRNVTHYAEQVMGWPATNVRDRVRLSRAAQKDPEFHNAYGQRHLGPQKALKLLLAKKRAGLPLKPRNDTEKRRNTAWIRHFHKTTLKRLDDEELLQLRQEALGPEPPTTEAWQKSLHRAPGRTLEIILQFGCHMLVAPARLGHLRHCDFWVSEKEGRDFLDVLRGVCERLQAGAQQDLTPAQTSRLRPSEHIARATLSRGESLQKWMALLWMLEEFALTHDIRQAHPNRKYRRIYERDGYRCTAPCCTSRQKINAHHIEYGDHRPEADYNLTSVCHGHHQEGEHAGRLKITGTAPLGVLWRLGRADDPDEHEWYRNEQRVDLP